ncbi:MAG: hypothetical protein E7078_00540 [Bacteroidales bacterium]|nr:hypothetical protein [Bacteroidales bacterium]
MKKYLIIALLFVVTAITVKAWDYINVRKGSISETYSLSQLDSITHKINNFVDIYHNNNSFSYSVADIDSITFEKSPFTIISNIDDPEIVIWKMDSEEEIHFYGTKDSNGYPLSINTVVIENKIDGSSKITFDEQMRPTRIYTNVGIIYDFLWIDDFHGVLTGYDTESNTIVKIGFDRTKEDGIAGNELSLKSEKNKVRDGEFSFSITPLDIINISKENVPFRDASEGYQKCLVHVMECDSYFDPQDVYLSVYNAKGHISNLHYYNKLGTGLFEFTIPSDNYIVIDQTEGWINFWDKLNNLLGMVGGISQWLATTNTDIYVCGAISVALAVITDGATLPILDKFTAGCVALNKILACLSYLNTGGTDSGASVTGLLIEELKKANVTGRVYKGELTLEPVTNLAISHPSTTLTPDQDKADLFIVDQGIPEIQNFYLEPNAPAAYQGYNAYSTIHCAGVGALVRMSIVGTDGYSKTEETRIWDTNVQVTMYVPGSYSGVHDVVTVELCDEYGYVITTQTASLYFH